MADFVDRLFAYGTLRCAEIISRVIGRVPVGSPAHLRGYRCLAVRNQPYPGLVEAAGELVAGHLYHDISSEEWARLDDFEGALYLRHQVNVELENGETHSAITYLVPPEFRHSLGESDWDYQTFLNVAKADFLSRE